MGGCGGGGGGGRRREGDTSLGERAPFGERDPFREEKILMGDGGKSASTPILYQTLVSDDHFLLLMCRECYLSHILG